jgi:hypothetical protein
VAADIGAAKTAFLDAAGDIDGINFAEAHDPDAGVPDALPGVTLSLIGMA